MTAVALFRTPKGCICFPEDREQALCAQHIIRWGINGNAVEILKVYDPLVAKQLGIEIKGAK
jgi:hypothetical protein